MKRIFNCLVGRWPIDQLTNTTGPAIIFTYATGFSADPPPLPVWPARASSRNRLMWYRMTCPNGHPLENASLHQAAVSKRCPECHAKVSLWTKVICPNGHTLKVRTKHGGGQG